MSPLFTVIVIILAVLAIIDLIVGVSNDAINFLNSALGSKVAKRWIILTVAAAGILLGVLTSNGMMEVARNGVFHPEMFTFENVMILFVAVMLADVVLLNTFNALGLPTSTTVSLIFELLGASIAVAMFTIWNDPSLSFADLGNYINTEKAMVMISGILLSVVIAFTVGAILMYVSRVIFSFKYAKSLRRYGAIWCGLAIVGIVYFAIFKGMKSSGLISDDFNTKLNQTAKFLAAGHKVKASIRFRGREMAHSALGADVLKRFAEALPQASMDKPPVLEGRTMSILLIPKPNKD